MSKKCIQITGGARSGKSRFAQELAVRSGKTVLFVATATAGDEEMKRRIEEHRKSRPAVWSALEATTHIGSQIEKRAGEAGVVLVDCLTLLLNNIFSGESEEQVDEARLEKAVAVEIKELIGCIDRVDADFIIVTNEVGLGLVPMSKIGRLYRDLLGVANQRLAERADEVYIMIASLPVKIKP